METGTEVTRPHHRDESEGVSSGTGLHPRRRDHHRQPPHEILEHPGRGAPGADHHAGSELQDRRAVLGEQPAGLVAAGQVRREVGILVVAETPRKTTR